MKSKTVLLTATILLGGSTAFAQDSDLVPLNVAQPEAMSGFSQGQLGELRTLPDGLIITEVGRVQLPDTDLSFDQLKDYTAGELAELLKRYIGLQIMDNTIQSAISIPEINKIIASTAVELGYVFHTADKIIVQTFDANGQPTLDDAVYIADEQGELSCTLADGLEDAGAGIVPRFEIMLDKSGSMKDVLPRVTSAARAFIDAMPTNAWCRVSTYNESYELLSDDNGLDGWKPCKQQNWDWNTIEAGGGTASTNALLWAYRGLNAPHPVPAFNGEIMSSLISITDGDGIGPGELPQIQQAKDDIPTFVYFEGTQRTTSYKSWADQYQTAAQGQDVATAFQVFANTFLYARVIDPTACLVQEANSRG